MDKDRAEKLIHSGATSPADAALALLWLRHHTRGARGPERRRALEYESMALERAGIPFRSNRRERQAEHTKAIFEGRVARQMERLRAIIRSEHPYVTVKSHKPTEWEAAHRLCRAGEAETWALKQQNCTRGVGEGRQWWTITRSEDEEERI